MKIIVDNKFLNESDHFEWHAFSALDFVTSDGCVLCGKSQSQFSSVENHLGDIGLLTKFCNSCGILSKTRYLNTSATFKHFAKSWLLKRDESIKADDSVYTSCAQYLSSGDQILDVGCGLGSVLLPFKQAGYDILGVEPSEHRSEIARKHLGSVLTGPIEHQINSIPDNTFKLIIFNDVFQFLQSPFQTLEQLNKKLVDGGFIFIKMGSLKQKAPAWQVAHNSVVLHSFSIRSLFKWAQSKSIGAKVFSKEPIVVMISSKFDLGVDLLSPQVEINETKLESFARKTLPVLKLRVLGAATSKFNGRSIDLRLEKRNTAKWLPLQFVHSSTKIPVMVK